MGYKVFTAGEEALASDVNSLLMSQTVARFASSAARSSALTAPVSGQLSILDSRAGVVQYWSGSAWLDVFPFIQSGTLTGTTDANGDINLTFPTPFAATPLTLASIGVVSAGNYAVVPQVLPISASTVRFRCLHQAAVWAYQGVNIYWLALGAKP